MKTTIPIFCMLVLLLVGSGCIDTESIAGNLSVNEIPATILYYENGNLSFPVDVSQIKVQDPGNFTVNVTSVITILLDDPRTGILLENGWAVTAISGAINDYDPNRTYADVEFEKDGLSFYILVDENERRTGDGYCSAEPMIYTGEFTRLGHPIPRYTQTKCKQDRMMHVFDHQDERLIMIYNGTTFYYLYPSYGSSTPKEYPGVVND